MRIDLVVCPACDGVSFFEDEACEGCLGRGYVPAEVLPHAIEVPWFDVDPEEYNPGINVSLGVLANDPSIPIPWEDLLVEAHVESTTCPDCGGSKQRDHALCWYCEEAVETNGVPF